MVQQRRLATFALQRACPRRLNDPQDALARALLVRLQAGDLTVEHAEAGGEDGVLRDRAAAPRGERACSIHADYKSCITVFSIILPWNTCET